jgi:hypothetical protein
MLSPSMVAAQRIPQPVFIELFAYDPTRPSQLLGSSRQVRRVGSDTRKTTSFVWGSDDGGDRC